MDKVALGFCKTLKWKTLKLNMQREFALKIRAGRLKTFSPFSLLVWESESITHGTKTTEKGFVKLSKEHPRDWDRRGANNGKTWRFPWNFHQTRKCFIHDTGNLEFLIKSRGAIWMKFLPFSPFCRPWFPSFHRAYSTAQSLRWGEFHGWAAQFAHFAFCTGRQEFYWRRGSTSNSLLCWNSIYLSWNWFLLRRAQKEKRFYGKAFELKILVISREGGT